jgi:hypothetical protein
MFLPVLLLPWSRAGKLHHIIAAWTTSYIFKYFDSVDNFKFDIYFSKAVKYDETHQKRSFRDITLPSCQNRKFMKTKQQEYFEVWYSKRYYFDISQKLTLNSICALLILNQKANFNILLLHAIIAVLHYFQIFWQGWELREI